MASRQERKGPPGPASVSVSSETSPIMGDNTLLGPELQPRNGTVTGSVFILNATVNILCVCVCVLRHDCVCVCVYVCVCV